MDPTTSATAQPQDRLKMEKLKHHTETSGEIDRGHATSPFEAISFNNRTGEYLRTRHQLEKLAMKRLQGNRRHSNKHIVDHTERFDEGKRRLPVRVLRPFGKDVK